MTSNVKACYALLGVSEEDRFDEMLGHNIAIKLDETEKEAILSNALKSSSLEQLYEEAKFYFADQDKVYYRNSRWTQASTLNKVDIKDTLTQCLMVA